jgi:hypothetical protein
MPTQAKPARFWRPLGAALLGLLTPAVGHAAPFCIGSEAVPPQCIYYDADSCRKEAIKTGGICSANAAEIRAGAQFAKYCVITSQQVSLCNYMDRTSCDAAALHYHGACVSSPEATAPGAPDPFAANGGK